MNINALEDALSRAEYQLSPDPGTGNVIASSSYGILPLTIGSAGAETNTLQVPDQAGVRLLIMAKTVGTGTRAITAPSKINTTGNTIITFTAVDQSIELITVPFGSTFRWQVVYNDATTLS